MDATAAEEGWEELGCSSAQSLLSTLEAHPQDSSLGSTAVPARAGQGKGRSREQSRLFK